MSGLARCFRAVTRRLVEGWAGLDGRTSAAPSPTPAGAGDLTGREREILVGLARGRTNRQLADELFVSEATVKTHVSSLLMKLGVRSRVQAVILAYASGIGRPGERKDIVTGKRVSVRVNLGGGR